jgi:hypothetical protein
MAPESGGGEGCVATMQTDIKKITM